MTDEKDVETVDNEAVVADLFARAEKDVIFAKALEAVVGGSPTGVLEDDDKALVEGYVAAHGVEHLVAHVERHNDYLAEQARQQAEEERRNAAQQRAEREAEERAKAQAKAAEARLAEEQAEANKPAPPKKGKK